MLAFAAAPGLGGCASNAPMPSRPVMTRPSDSYVLRGEHLPPAATAAAPQPAMLATLAPEAFPKSR